MGLTVAEKESRTYVVYFLRCPFTNYVRYVGITSSLKARQKCHLSTPDGFIAKRAWISGLRRYSVKPIMQVVTPDVSHDEAVRIEKRLIFKFTQHRPGQLFNGDEYYWGRAKDGSAVLKCHRHWSSKRRNKKEIAHA